MEGRLRKTETVAAVISLQSHGILPRAQWENIPSIKDAGIMKLIRMKQDENNNSCILEWDDTSFFLKSLMHFCKIKKNFQSKKRVDILIYLCSFKSIINS